MARAKTQDVISNEITVTAQKKEEKYDGPRVPITLPLREEDSVGLTVDKHEHVTISNELGTNTDYVQRGIPCEVSVPTFILLKQKYPNI